MNVLLIQCDGIMPNLALMRLAAHHRQQGDHVELIRCNPHHDFTPGLFDQWDKVYASLIFTKSQPTARNILKHYPHAVVGGTGWGLQTIEKHAGVESLRMDYADYPSERRSIGFSQRGCRLDCDFCVVGKKEGKVKDVATIRDIWRGEPWPRDIVLLDNDFFGSPTWRDKIAEIKAGRFRVSLAQGINARLLPEEGAAALASINYRSIDMRERRIYTAWDDYEDKGPLFRGLRALTKYGVRPDDIMVYMLLRGPELREEDFERHRELREFGVRPYPMPLIRGKKGEPGYELVRFQTFVVHRIDMKTTWQEYKRAGYRQENMVA